MQHDVWIPALHRDLTDGVESVSLPGSTVGDLVEQLDEMYPGDRRPLCEDGRIRPYISVAVNGD
ncbi:MAG: MoaD/ThiS family protein, partial [Caldilineaceae bacterium]|nr:MoaD/ThiS family protein [Caldilineaceae bacterium]